MKCKHENDDGSRCEAPENFVDPETGFCHAHGPGGSETMSEWGKKGGRAKAKKDRAPGLDPEDLPPLDGPRAAEKWCEIIGRAVTTGKLAHREAQAAIKAVREWLRSHEAGEVEERVDDLQEKVAKLKRGDLEEVA